MPFSQLAKSRFIVSDLSWDGILACQTTVPKAVLKDACGHEIGWQASGFRLRMDAAHPISKYQHAAQASDPVAFLNPSRRIQRRGSQLDSATFGLGASLAQGHSMKSLTFACRSFVPFFGCLVGGASPRGA
jgi:hypothetical protein